MSRPSGAHRPAVTGDVVHDQHQHLLVRRPASNSQARIGTSTDRSNAYRVACSTASASSAGGDRG